MRCFSGRQDPNLLYLSLTKLKPTWLPSKLQQFTSWNFLGFSTKNKRIWQNFHGGASWLSSRRAKNTSVYTAIYLAFAAMVRSGAELCGHFHCWVNGQKNSSDLHAGQTPQKDTQFRDHYHLLCVIEGHTIRVKTTGLQIPSHLGALLCAFLTQ